VSPREDSLMDVSEGVFLILPRAGMEYRTEEHTATCIHRRSPTSAVLPAPQGPRERGESYKCPCTLRCLCKCGCGAPVMLEIGVAPTLNAPPPETALLAVLASSSRFASRPLTFTAAVGLGNTYDVYVGLYPGMLTQ
jgi:hypothetical protein